jgi:dihydrofolate synthase/folylpolyglutamate synthase
VGLKGSTHAIIGMLRDKDRVRVFEQIQALVDCWHVVDLPAPRGAASAQLAAELSEIGTKAAVNAYANVADALLTVRDLVQPGDCVLVTGSFLTVSAAMRALTL